MQNPLDFQSIIIELEKYWAGQGCLIWQPYHTEVGAGTYNPATSLRVLGPEPWNVAYVEPSIRPDDGRYGVNPNRFYQHIQYQVILKPDPGNPQELYLKSLMSLGINPEENDIRFVEDNWESPVLGSWGLGWEVWLNGLEITQFTYFQQAGGIKLDPISVEITYGLERIAMALQNVKDYRDLQWNSSLLYSDVYFQNEQEFSKYSFETGSVERLQKIFNLYEQEAYACLEEGLVLPAHDYVLKCSHTFNVLDTRGVIGVTERQAFFRKMRSMSRKVAEAYAEQRQLLEYPWLDKAELMALPNRLTKSSADTDKTTPPTTAQPFVFEIGTEELPAGDITKAIIILKAEASKLFRKLRLNHNGIHVFSTPRRLALYIDSLDANQTSIEKVVKGPPIKRAYHDDGSPTQAMIGFAKSKDLAIDELQEIEIDGGKYIGASIIENGLLTSDVLINALQELLGQLKFNRQMRWNDSKVNFSRPIRWITAMHGKHVIPIKYAGLFAANTTRGLRFSTSEIIYLSSAHDYIPKLSDSGIIIDPEERKSIILTGINSLAAQIEGTVIQDDALLAEVTNLVEAPLPLLGKFSEEHLALPREVLISVMKKHQRYFSIERDGDLIPYFITVANKSAVDNPQMIIDGNEDVVEARFADAAYFIKADLSRPFEAYIPSLGKLTYQEKLGSMLDKTERLKILTKHIAELLSVDQATKEIAIRSAELCKADLATQMVVDMTSLQGTIGKNYALASGEPHEVASAIYEHYLPRTINDDHPRSTAGFIVGVADRIDSLIGLFAAGLAPTSTKDPFGLRRTAMGLVSNLINRDVSIDLVTILTKAASLLPIDVDNEMIGDCVRFISERQRNLLLDKGYKYDVIEAVLSVQKNDPASTMQTITELGLWVNREDWKTILPAFSRCVRIVRSLQENYEVDRLLLVEKAEINLFEAVKALESALSESYSLDEYLNEFIDIIPYIDTFFEDVLVMVEDLKLQHNRLGLLQKIASGLTGLANLSHLEGF